MGILPFYWRSNAPGWGGGLGQDYPYQTLTGRELYALPSISRLNILPVVTLKNYILHGAKLTGNVPYAPGFPPMTAEELVDVALLDGTYLWMAGALQSDIVRVSREQIIQLLYDVELQASGDSRARTVDITRRYTRGPQKGYDGQPYNEIYGDLLEGEWLIEDFEGRLIGNTGALVDDSSRIVKDGDKENGVVLLLNGLGPLAEAQGTYWYLEELCGIMRDESTGPNSAMWIKGIPLNEGEALAAAEDKTRKVKFLPGEFDIVHGGNTPLLQHLSQLYTLALSRYYSTMTMTDISDQPGRPVAEDLFLRMGPMLRGVDQHRERIQQACKLWGAEITFKQIHTETVADRQAEFDFIQAQLALEYITPGQAKELSLILL